MHHSNLLLFLTTTGLQYSSEGRISEYLGDINSTDYLPYPGIAKLQGCSSLVLSGSAQIFTGNYSSHVVCCITTTPLGSVVFPSIDGLLRFQGKRTSLVYSLAPGFCIAGINVLPLSFGLQSVYSTLLSLRHTMYAMYASSCTTVTKLDCTISFFCSARRLYPELFLSRLDESVLTEVGKSAYRTDGGIEAWDPTTSIQTSR